MRARILDDLLRAVGLVDVILHVRHGGDQVEIEFALQPLAHDLHVQKAEEAAAKPEPQRHRRFGLVVQGSVVELQFGERVAQLFVLFRVRGVEPREHHRLDLPIPGEQRRVAVLRVQDGVSRSRFFDAADVGDEVADFAGLQLLRGFVAQLQIAYLVDLVEIVLVSAEHDLHPGAQPAIHDANAGDRAAIAVVVGIEDQGPQRRLGLSLGRPDAMHHRFEHLRHTRPVLGRDAKNVRRVRPDEIVDLLRAPVRLGAGEVDLVEHRDDLEPRIEREKEVGQRLGLNALRGVHHENRPLAGRQRTGDLVGEVHMARRVDQVELVELAVARVVVHPHRVQLDGDAPLPLQIHGVQHLFAHQALVERARQLDQAVGQRGLAMVDVGDDAEVADVGLAHVGRKISYQLSAIGSRRRSATRGLARTCR